MDVYKTFKVFIKVFWSCTDDEAKNVAKEIQFLIKKSWTNLEYQLVTIPNSKKFLLHVQWWEIKKAKTNVKTFWFIVNTILMITDSYRDKSK